MRSRVLFFSRAFYEYQGDESRRSIIVPALFSPAGYRHILSPHADGLPYLDLTTEQEMKALATLEDEQNQKVSVKWNPEKDTLSDICGLRKLKK